MTAAVAKKVKRIDAKRAGMKIGDNDERTGSPVKRPAFQEKSSLIRLRSEEIPLPASLQVSIEDVATNYILFSYSNSSSFVYLATDDGRYTATVLLNRAVLLAPALALLSRQTQQPGILDQARQKYVEAVVSTNLALSNRSSARTDSTLLSVLLLALYEATVFRGRELPTGWTTHTLGAAALLSLRGTEQFYTPLGRALFMHAASSIRASCLQRKRSVPPVLVAFHGLMPPQSEQVRDPAFAVMPILDEVADLLKEFCDPSFKSSQTFQESVAALNKKVALLIDVMQETWPYEVVDKSKEHKTHRYSSYHSARHWNMLRMTRILVNGMLIQLAADNSSFIKCGSVIYGIESLVSLSEDLARNILASVPYLLNTAHNSVTVAAQCLLWPLYMVASCRRISVYAAGEARHQLELLHRNFGIPQAREALNMPKERTLTDWYAIHS